MVPFLDLKAATAELRPELDQAIARVLDSGVFTFGEEVDAFELEFAAHCGTRFCIGVNSGVHAMTMTLESCEIREGDEVIFPESAEQGTWIAVVALGGEPIPVRGDEVEAAITPRTRALVITGGNEHPMETLAALALRHRLRLITDGFADPLADASAFDFDPFAPLGALGDVGAVVTSDAALAERVRAMSGSCRFDSLQAAVLRVKLKHLDEWNARRSWIARRYAAGLEGLPDLTLPRRNVWDTFPVRYPDCERFQRQLARSGIEAWVTALPALDPTVPTELCLPMHPHLTGEQVEEVIEAVRHAVCWQTLAASR